MDSQNLKREDQLRDISNMNLSELNKSTDKLIEKSQELRAKATEQLNTMKSQLAEIDEKENLSHFQGERASTSFSERSSQSTQRSEVHKGEKTLTEQKKEEILHLTEKLTEKIQALKQTDNTQIETESSTTQQTQSFEQSSHPSQQEDIKSQSISQSNESAPEQGSQDISSKISEKIEDVKEELKPAQERQPIVDKVLGRVHDTSDNLHKKVEDIKSAFKVEEEKDINRVPLIDQVSESIHNVTDRISHKIQSVKGVFRAVKSKFPFAKKQKGAATEEEGIEEETFASYGIGEEFTEVIDGFSKTMERALQDESLGEETNVGKVTQDLEGGQAVDEDVGHEYLDFKIQGFDEFRKEGTGEWSNLKDMKTGYTGVSGPDQGTDIGAGQENLRPLGEDISLGGDKAGSTEQIQGSGEQLGHAFQDFKIQGVQDLHNEGSGEASQLKDIKSENVGISQETDIGAGQENLKPLGEDISKEGEETNVEKVMQDLEGGQAHAETVGHEYLDYKYQGFDEFRKEGTGEWSNLKDMKTGYAGVSGPDQETDIGAGQENLRPLGEDISSGGDKSELAGKIESSDLSTEPPKRKKSLLEKLDEDIKMIDQLLEKSVVKGKKTETKESTTSVEKGFGSLTNQSAEIGVSEKKSSLTQKVYQDVDANDKLIEQAILSGGTNQSKDTSESSATKLHSQSSGQRTEKFRDITNEVAGSEIGQQGDTSFAKKVYKDVSSNDQMLDKAIREGGKADYRFESEDKENMGMKGQKPSFSESEGFRNITQNI